MTLTYVNDFVLFKYELQFNVIIQSCSYVIDNSYNWKKYAYGKILFRRSF